MKTPKTLLSLLFLVALFLVTTILPMAAQQPRVAPTEQRSTHTPTLLEQGKTFYQAGRFAEAAALWQQVAQNYERQGDRLNQALTLNYLSLAYQDLGQWQAAESAIAASLDLLHNLELKTQPAKLILAQALNTQGSLQLAIGQTEAALGTWRQAADTYAQAGYTVGTIGCQINEAQALQILGLYRQAQTILEQVNQQLQAQPDSQIKATGLRSLGVALQVVGNLQKSQEVLDQSLAMTQRLGASQDTSDTLFSLGNTARALQDYPRALRFYKQAAATATNPINKLEAQLNQLSLSLQEQQTDANALLPQIQSQLTNLPASRAVVYARVNLAESMMKMAAVVVSRRGTAGFAVGEVAQVLAIAVQQARELNDPKAESYALGQLGHLYQQTQQWAEAQQLTQQALQIAQATNSSFISYRWQWQLGQILKQQGQLTEATAAYTEAVKVLQSLRSDLVAMNPDVQFSFRESVEPVYRELVGLLLQPPFSQENLKQARQLIESLKLAELENFFREACLKAPAQIDQVDPTAAVIYPIILPDRLAVILCLPGQPLHYYETRLPQLAAEGVINQMLESLNPAISTKVTFRLSQQIYDWLIRPIETQLAASEVKTLVFILDDAFQNLPMAVLYDGQHYLVEKYSIALSQGLQLLEPRVLVQKHLKALMGGITEARQGFSSLPAVEFELRQIASRVPAKVLLNQGFVKTSIESQIETVPYLVIHFATHGQFSSQAENTFLLTWDGRINVKDLDRLLRVRERADRAPIELLVLSACQTAASDKRATLGLAGVAVRSGARSTLATLWSVRDQSTAELMAEFYRQLTQPAISKAEALRQAQIALLRNHKYNHPFYWAPFILLGNWL